MSTATKAQRAAALGLYRDLRNLGEVPSIITPSEAASLAERFGVNHHRYDRTDHGSVVSLASVTLLIARHGKVR